MIASRKIASHYLLTPQGLLPRAIVSIDSRGVINSISTSENLDRVDNLEFYSGVLIPGMVNAHCHLELSYLKGLIPRGCGFAGFAKSLSEVRNNFPLDKRLRSIEFQDATMWAEGVSLVGDVCNGSTTLDVKSRSKIQYFDFPELFGLGSSLDDMSECIANHKLTSVDYNLSPHSCYSLNSEAFSSVINNAEKTKPISVHFMETDSESELFAREGELWQWYESRGSELDFLGEKSPVDRILNNVSQDQKIFLVHNTSLGLPDAKRLVDYFGDNLTWVLCPKSNLYISGRLPDVDMLRCAGGRIVLGTDSLSSNDSLSLAGEMKLLSEMVPLEELLAMVTYNGYDAFGSDSFGAEPGRVASLVLLDTTSWTTRRII